MKKLFIYGMISLLALSMMPTTVQARSNSASTHSTTPAENPQAQALLSRLEEIKAVDKTELTSSEKKDLRKEVRSIKQELKTMNGGVYLSVGAIIIIVLLLILLL
jgi:peptidoglycan hydrolase CwlO-like protein